MREKLKIEETNKISFFCDYCGGPLDIIAWNEEKKAFLLKCKICKRMMWWKARGDNNGKEEKRN